MFDDNQPMDNNTSASTPPSNIPSEPITPNTAVPPPVSQATKASEEPEDIFDKSSPAIDNTGKDNPFKPASNPNSNVPGSPEPSVNMSSNPIDEGEPAIKSPDGLIAQKPSSSMPVIPPEAPGMGGNKNITSFVIIIILVLGLIGTSVWYFILRDKPALTDDAVLSEDGLFNPPATVDDTTSGLRDLMNNINSNNENNSDEREPLQDSDQDGLSDEEELLLGTSLQSVDTDNDNLYDYEEVKTYNTDPLLADTDGDGVKDGSEVENNTDPLVVDTSPADDNFYRNNNYKFSLTTLPGMVLESDTNNQVLFNDNVNQVKLYIYVSDSQPENLTPDVGYSIYEDQDGLLGIEDRTSYPDSTPYSTDYSTIRFTSTNGHVYIIRYIATKRSDSHQSNFEEILSGFRFLP